MPTTRPRHQVTETPPIEHAIDVAAKRWPGETRSRLLRRLIEIGRTALEHDGSEALQRRRAAVSATGGSYSGVFDPDHLARLRADWPD